MEREEAIQKIRELIGADLRPLADRYGVTVWKEDKINKGWAGHVIERYLGLAINSSRSPNFGSWELKVIPLKFVGNGELQVKETMAVTMIDPVEVIQKEFEDSHLYNKLKKALVVARVFESKSEESSVLYSVSQFDLHDPRVFTAVKDDYDTIRGILMSHGFEALTGRIGEVIQPRTKGPGHGSTSRAFYARVPFVAHIVGIAPHPLLIK